MSAPDAPDAPDAACAADGLTLLHTSPVHVPVFDALRDRHHPGTALRHLVVPGLLARARVAGPAAVAGEIESLLAGQGSGDGAVLCTCSTIGAVAEDLGPALGRQVLRVDRPMAAAAVRTGPRIAVLATVESTLAPTLALLREEADALDRARPGYAASLSLRPQVVPGAWERFEAGDDAGCLGLVAAAADAVTGADVIVLAQVSMAGAVERATTDIPLLSSPSVGLAAAVGALRRA
ncbi:arylsulfatase [Streptomyces sp. NBC_00536]|uniref:arylsulfatase n=1 Tax=Streptomyces sp. NBC_00536 TaxID=2975769 RepID=UPI002E803F52|nr:arylsulfatase [Streptomyces sp. NBC_00536]WUC82480.1 arylsulfatase [Streptomyces sp. NBC_00536]